MEADLSSKSNYLPAEEQLTGRRKPSRGGARVQAISARSSNLQLQQTVFLLNKMQLDGSFIPSQSSELIENGFSVSLMNVFGSIRY